MSAAQTGSAAAVTKPGKCDRIVFFGRNTHVIKYNSRLDPARGGKKGMRKYFATWSPYRMRKVHVEFIGKEIDRPNSILEGAGGTMEMYYFTGANTPKYDAQTTTEGLEDDELVVLKREGGLA